MQIILESCASFSHLAPLNRFCSNKRGPQQHSNSLPKHLAPEVPFSPCQSKACQQSGIPLEKQHTPLLLEYIARQVRFIFQRILLQYLILAMLPGGRQSIATSLSDSPWRLIPYQQQQEVLLKQAPSNAVPSEGNRQLDAVCRNFSTPLQKILPLSPPFLPILLKMMTPGAAAQQAVKLMMPSPAAAARPASLRRKISHQRRLPVAQLALFHLSLQLLACL